MVSSLLTEAAYLLMAGILRIQLKTKTSTGLALNATVALDALG